MTSLLDDYELPYPFSAPTYGQRLARLREQMREDDVGGLIAVDQSSLFYLFGYDQIGYWVFQAVWIPANENEPVRGICRAPDRALMSRGIGIDSVEVWVDDVVEPPTDRIAQWVSDTGVRSVALELESHALRADHAFELAKALTARGVELRPGSGYVTRRREIKDAEEVSFFRTAARALDAAFDALEGLIEPDRTETDLAAAVTLALLDAGCDPSAIPPCISAGRRTMFQTHMSAKPLRLPAGDVVTVEIGAAIQRYHAVGYRTLFTEGAPQAYIDQYRALREAVLCGVEQLGPGRPSTDASNVIQLMLDRAGSSRPNRHVGYSTGIGFPPNWLEGLRLKASQTITLKPGMTFFVFAGAPTRDEQRHIGYGVPVVITDSGADVVSVEGSFDASATPGEDA